jgi:hypothetical protein
MALLTRMASAPKARSRAVHPPGGSLQDAARITGEQRPVPAVPVPSPPSPSRPRRPRPVPAVPVPSLPSPSRPCRSRRPCRPRPVPAVPAVPAVPVPSLPSPPSRAPDRPACPSRPICVVDPCFVVDYRYGDTCNRPSSTNQPPKLPHRGTSRRTARPMRRVRRVSLRRTGETGPHGTAQPDRPAARPHDRPAAAQNGTKAGPAHAPGHPSPGYLAP